jgi:hypothetical protein
MAVQHLRLIACPFARLECVASRSEIDRGDVTWGRGVEYRDHIGGCAWRDGCSARVTVNR